MWDADCAHVSAAMDRMEEQINKRRIEHDAPSGPDERGQDKAQRDAILSGASGITGEDFGVADRHHIARS